MKEKPEAIILRREYDPYMDMEKVLVIYPEVPTRAYWLACQTMYFDGRDTAWFENCDECSRMYYLKTKPLRDTELIEKCKKALEERYNQKFRVMQKIVGRY